ncbi:Type III restriction-modification system methylation subunit (EC 2.1.1.72) [uncultured Gammaproteobacteria bacterium]|nr:Type III restriction-modification system methylation subunit (EC 2.1.1.72) [uncultured Gammaproteobacteria bacterium]
MDKDKKIQELSLIIKNLEKKLEKKYGLVWEDKPEQFDEDSKNALPILKSKNDNKYPDIKTDKVNGKNPHILIEGDNYHALSVLNYTHKGKIDVIYIDPPYNTGNKDFKYNDSFVDKEDSFRHSKWLSFMAKRLKLAKNLLTEDGVIFISIDDNEQAQLKLLCDEVFGSKNFIDSIVWDKKSSAKGVPPRNMIVNVHEYIVTYQKYDGFKFVGEERTKESGKFKNPDNDPRGPWRESNIKSTIKPIEEAFTIVDPNTGKEYTNTWAFSKESLELMIKEERILWKNTLPKQKEFMLGMRNEAMAIKSNWGVFDPQSTTVLLKQLIPKVKFDNPKPIGLMEYLIKIATNKNATILDFFAGSGTTGHAVLELNKDGGNRQFILCTNNENNICEEVTYERIKRVMQGYTTPKDKEVEGLGGELKYFKTAFVQKQTTEEITDEDKINLTYETGMMLALKENTFDEIKREKFYQVFASDENITAIYFSESTSQLGELLEFLELQNKPAKLYLFSWVKGNSDEFSEYENIIVEDIPEPILEIYQNLGII